MRAAAVLRPAVVAFALAAAAALAQPVKIEFESKNYAGYKELIAGKPSGPSRIVGYLSLPRVAQGKVPAVVLLPHSGGYSENQERWYRGALNAAGFATFFLDNYSPRGLRPPVTVRDISYATVVADAYAALAELARRTDIDARRIAVLGFSRGAEAARQAAFESLRRGAGAGELRFAAHVAHYPLCVTSMRDPADMTGAPVRLALGAKDEDTPARLCEHYVAFMKAQRPQFPVEIRVYADALHAWDEESATGQYALRAPTSKNCIPLLLSPAGEFESMVRDGTEVPFERSILGCPGVGGAMKFDAAIRERATAAFVEFLKTAMSVAN